MITKLNVYLDRRIIKWKKRRQIAKTGLLPENAIRVMLKNGQIKAVYSGRKALINFDNLCEYLKTLTVVG